jgi:hypothetical protein
MGSGTIVDARAEQLRYLIFDQPFTVIIEDFHSGAILHTAFISNIQASSTEEQG